MSRLTADAEAARPGHPVVLRITGSLDVASASVLHDALSRCLFDEPEIVVLDFAAVTEASDEAAKTLFVLADRAMAWPGATVVLGGAVPPVAAALAAPPGGAGTAGVLPVYPSVGLAVAGALAARARDAAARMQLSLPPVDSAAASARRLADRACAAWGLHPMRDTLRLIATELVSNAVRHATTALDVGLTRWGNAVYVSVRDRSAAQPRRTVPASPLTEGGRGLLVVDLMSRAWGSTPTPDGKVVWASVATP
jgi:hypothetical protein